MLRRYARIVFDALSVAHFLNQRLRSTRWSRCAANSIAWHPINEVRREIRPHAPMRCRI